jgi:hypothetical protein
MFVVLLGLGLKEKIDAKHFALDRWRTTRYHRFVCGDLVGMLDIHFFYIVGS